MFQRHEEFGRSRPSYLSGTSSIVLSDGLALTVLFASSILCVSSKNLTRQRIPRPFSDLYRDGWCGGSCVLLIHYRTSAVRCCACCGVVCMCPGLFFFSLISTSRMPRSALWLPTADSSAWSSGKGAAEVGRGAEKAGEYTRDQTQDGFSVHSNKLCFPRSTPHPRAQRRT